MKKKILPALVVIGLILLIVAGIIISNLIKKYTPTDERADLYEHFGVTSDSDAAILLNHQPIDSYATLINGAIYLDYWFVHDTLNPRFYWDENENILFYTTSSDLISANADATSYLVTKTSVDYGKPIVKATAESAWIEIDFVNMYSDFTYTYYEAPSRILITNQWGEVDIANIKKDTSMRVLGGIKSPILADLTKNTSVYVLAQDVKWTKIITEEGITGYVQSKYLNDFSTKTLTSDFVYDTFTHITRDFEISMAWHQVTSLSSNDKIASLLAETKGINVISPTWFILKDNDGGLTSYASSDYVSYCHQQGIEVWPTVNNIDDANADSTYVLTHSSSRHNLVNQIVSYAIQYNLDGINMDFEELSGSKTNEAYMQFLRELSLKCANNDIVLSVDNYPFASSAEQAAFVDYVVIMGYNEHYVNPNGNTQIGSVASLDWVKEAVYDALEDVPAEQLILGMPFYTRIWCSTPDNDESDTEIIYDITASDHTMRYAYNLVKDNNADIQWIDSCGQYYSKFQCNGSIYEVWLEDAESTEQRLKVIDENKLAGAAYWKLGLEYPNTWDTIIKYIN